MKQFAVGLFSGLCGPNAGGVQVSGRLAWGAIAQYALKQNRTAGLLVYGHAEEQDVRLAKAGSIVAANKWQAIWGALAGDWRAPVVCFWHVGMLRLLPWMRLGQSKTVLFLHGIETWQLFNSKMNHLLRRVDLFLSNSEFTWQRFIQYNPEFARKPHQTVALGYGEPSSSGLHSDTNGGEPAALILGRIVRGEDYKGHRELISAWSRVVSRIPKAQLWIAGDGDLRADLENQVVKTKLGENVHFLGRITEAEKHERLERCRCFAMPSQAEGFGLVYLEAMRLGRPCLVSTLDAAREVVNPPEAGLAVNPADSSAVSDSLCRLMSIGPEWDTWSRAARERYENLYTAEHFSKRLLSALFVQI